MMQSRRPIIVVDAGDNNPARGRGMHHPAVANVHAHMVHPPLASALATKKQQVARAKPALAYLATEFALLSRIARQFEVRHVEVYTAH